VKDQSMSVYTVYQPPLRPADSSPATDRFVFVRDGFSWWAFLLTPLWMLRHRLWLVLTVYVLALAGIDAALRALGASALTLMVVGALVSLFVGLEAGTLRRLTLSGRGWRNIGVVGGHDAEEAERRFFDAWVRRTVAQRSAPPEASASSPSPSPATTDPFSAERSGVIGLFPEPGGHR
jgi:Protein of unknown function (DUF2628)